METLWADLKYTFRALAKTPMFTVVAVASLALGIGANGAIFSLLDQVLFRTLPVKDPQDLVLFNMVGRFYGSNWGNNSVSYPMYSDFKAHNEVFSDMFARFSNSATLRIDKGSERVQIELVSGSYFPVLGVRAGQGRVFTPEDDVTPSGHPVAVLSHAYWESNFGKDPNVIGKKVLMNNYTFTIIGVAQPGFEGIDIGGPAQMFVPLAMTPQMMPQRPFLSDRRTRWVNVFGRLKPGVTRQQAQASIQPYMHSMLEMEVLEPAFRNASGTVRAEFLKSTMDLLPGSQGRANIRLRLRAPLYVLMAITGTVLLIACANLANLLLARAAGREREIAVRLAVGAGRWRITRQLLTESLTLSAIGGVAGIAVAFAADKFLLAAFVPSDSSGMAISAVPDQRVLLFTTALSAITGLLFGLFPAWRATKPDLAPTLKDQAGGVVGGGNVRLRKVLVASQVMLSLVLLVGAGLFVKSLGNLRGLGPGFSTEKLIAFDTMPPAIGYNAEATKQFYQRLNDTLKATPGVQSAGMAALRIMRNNQWDNWITVEGYTPKPGDRPSAYMNSITPNYFATLGVPFVAGRDFTAQDTEQVLHTPPDNWVSPKIIVNEAFVKHFFNGQSGIGKRVGFGIDPGTKMDMEIIGVVKDINYMNVRNDIPYQAFVPALISRTPGGLTTFVRTSAQPEAMFSAIRAKVRELEPALPINSLRTVEEDVSDTLVTERMTASLSAIFGFLATGLAVIGLYGVMAYSVARRTREIGIRVALGAGESNVVWMVMREVLILVGVGVVIALPAAFALTRLVRTQLFGVTPTDPWTLAIATVALTAVACAAGYIPALRASRINPILALRNE